MAKKSGKKSGRKGAAPTTTSFAKMGTEAATAAAVSDPSPNLKFVRRGNARSGVEPATKNNRKGTQERLGFMGAPQVGVTAQNAESAGDMKKNVRLVPSAIGNRDFYLRRRYGQTGNFG